jgi:lysozyme family protein
MKDNFQKSLGFVLKDEGGLDDDPSDHGGRTAYGITQHEFTAWRIEHKLPEKDVWKITKDEYTTMYHDEYWAPWCDSLPTGVDYLYFDMAVNSGPHEATLLLQRALGVADDGRIGPITRNAIRLANPSLLIDNYTQQKKHFYISLHQSKFLRGWLNRCVDVHNNALAMLKG